MKHYILIFKYRRGREIHATSHCCLFTANLFSKYLKRKGFKTIAFLKVNQ